MLRFDSIHFCYDDVTVLADVTFTAAPGAVTCVVGPSGCGKTTLLKLAAGLLEVQRGEIHIDDRCVASATAHVPPEKRSVGLVFQEGALFPHLTVLDNVTFGVPGGRRNARVDELLALTGLAALAERLPHELSGGQRQRVALARALAPSPRVLLFDEPYANLDQALRRQLREEARRIVTDAGTVAVFVTHDHEDVSALADEVVAMHEGRIVQRGSPRELFDHPRHGSVARLFGQAQQIRGQQSGDVVETPFGTWPAGCLAISADGPGAIDLLVRPDGLVLEAAADGMPVTEIRMDGADDLVGVAGRDGTIAFVRCARPHGFARGSQVNVRPVVGRVFPEVVANESHSQ